MRIAGIGSDAVAPCLRGRGTAWPRRARCLTAAVFTGLAMTAAGCGGEDDGGGGASSGSKDVKIGFVLALSGAGATYADPAKQAFEAALVQGAEAFPDLDVTTVTVDNATDPRTSSEVCRRLATQEEVDVIVAFETSANREACLPLAERRGIPYVYTVNYEGGVCSPSFFSTGEVPNQQIAPLVDYMMEQGARRFFQIGSDYVWPRQSNAYAREYIESRGGEVVGEEYMPLDSSDFSSVLGAAARSGADAIFDAVVGGDEVAMIKQIAENPELRDVMVGSIAMEDANQRAIGPAAANVAVAWSYFPSLENAANDAFKQTLREQFGHDATAGVLGPAVYDAVMLALAAADKAPSVDPESIAAGLREVTFEGPRGTVKLTDEGTAVLPAYVGVADGRGAFEIVSDEKAVEPSTFC